MLYLVYMCFGMLEDMGLRGSSVELTSNPMEMDLLSSAGFLLLGFRGLCRAWLCLRLRVVAVYL